MNVGQMYSTKNKKQSFNEKLRDILTVMTAEKNEYN